MRHYLLLAGLLVSFNSMAGEDDDSEKGFSLAIDVSPWYASWKQESTAADRFGADAIKVRYAIDDTLAYSYGITVGYNKWYLSLTDISQSQTYQEHSSKVSYTKYGFTAVDFLGDFSLDYRFINSEFNGFIDGADNNGNTGTGTFKTDLKIQDVGLYFFRGLGLGIRQIEYSVPQDIYLVNNAAPNTALVAGFQEIEYSGAFAQVILKSGDHFRRRQKDPFGVSYIARYGVGKLKPGGKFLHDTEKLLRDAGTIGAKENIMEEGKSKFVELDIGAYKRFKFYGGQYKASVGYRYTQWQAEFDSNSDYQLVADFESSFYGPYVSLTGEFR